MSKLTPALLDLMEHEKVIDQGLGTFIDVGNALAAIRDGEKWRALKDCESFEDYCQARWGLKRAQAYNQIAAAAVVDVLSTAVENPPLLPSHETQVRPLKRLRKTPDLMCEAWAEAVNMADGHQPTADEVKTAVLKRRPDKARVHPAKFSDPILSKMGARLAGAELVLDPFAGAGRIHELAESGIVAETIGVEIEPEWAALHDDTIEGDALDLPLADGSVTAIATSPTYGNRMADHHDAADVGERNTYKHTLGHDLAEHNSGQLQWGEEYRDFHRRAWAESYRVLIRGGTFCVNVKDHVRDGDKQDVVAWHIDTLKDLGLQLIGLDFIVTRGLMSGENAEARDVVEVVATFRKP